MIKDGSREVILKIWGGNRNTEILMTAMKERGRDRTMRRDIGETWKIKGKKPMLPWGLQNVWLLWVQCGHVASRISDNTSVSL